MDAVINIVLPVFGIVLAGYFVGRAGILGAASSEALNGFVYYVALPALFFLSMAQLEPAEAPLAPFLTVVGGSMLGTFGLAVLVAALIFPGRLGAIGLNGLSSVFANTGYMGIPLLLTAFGQAALLPGIIATVLNGVVVLGIGTVLLEFDRAEGRKPVALLGTVTIAVMKSPLLLSALAGLAVAFSGWPLPTPLVTFCDILSEAVGPCALFSMGLFMVGRSMTRGPVEIGWITGLKLIVHPVIAWWMVMELVYLPPVWANSAVLLAALPTGALVFVLAQRYQVYVQRSTAVILVSTVLSVATLSFVILALG